MWQRVEGTASGTNVDEDCLAKPETRLALGRVVDTMNLETIKREWRGCKAPEPFSKEHGVTWKGRPAVPTMLMSAWCARKYRGRATKERSCGRSEGGRLIGLLKLKP